MDRFDVDYVNDEVGCKQFESELGDYVLADDALKLQAKVEELTARLNLLEANNFKHSKPYMVCVPREIWAVAFPEQEG
jgi:hypothetical protein